MTSPTTGRLLTLVVAATSVLATAFAPPPLTPVDAPTPDGESSSLPPEEDPATYGADHLVDVGARDPSLAPEESAARFEYLAYYPDVLRVHRGDTVYFRLVQFHTVTFSDPAEPWRGLYRTDEAGGIIQTDGALPSHPDCGRDADDDPCIFADPTAYVNSGWDLDTDAFQGDLKLTFDLPAGPYTYYCTVHPGMEGTVQVVDDAEPIPTPTEVAQERAKWRARDTATGEHLKANPPTIPDPEVVGDHRRWFVQVGATSDDHRVAVLSYFPSVLAIEPGDEVEFFVPESGTPPVGRVEPAFEGHTVGFEPAPLRDNDPVNPFLRYLVGMCDPDDPNGGLPGHVQPASFIVGCGDVGQTPEIAWNPQAFRRPAAVPHESIPPGTYYDSGLLGPADTPCRLSCDPYDGSSMIASEVRAHFPVADEFGYRCFLHGAMDGVISVSG